MSLLSHIGLFLLCIGAVWFCAGVIVELVERLAKYFNKSGFFIAFFVLGFITSLGEFSVAANSFLNGTPEISTGNIIGASFALLVLIVPLLAVIGNGVKMDKVFDGWRLFAVLGFVMIPPILLMFGVITWHSGLFIILGYIALVLMMRKQSNLPPQEHTVEKDTPRSPRPRLWRDIGKIIVCSAVIFFAGNILVGEAVFFADYFRAPQYLIGILLLSFGTNIPEIAVAVRSVLKKQSEVALGNYLGSAAMNTLTFGLLALVSGSFFVQKSDFLISFIFIIIGFILLYVFVKTKDILSRSEGVVLLLIYGAFIAIQIYALIRFATG